MNLRVHIACAVVFFVALFPGVGRAASTVGNNVSTDGTLTVGSLSLFNGNVTLGSDTSDAITILGLIQGSTPFVFEGAIADAFETTFAFTEPTADNTITFQNASGTVAFLSDIGGGGGSDDLDTVYAADADKVLDINDGLGLVFDLTSSGDFLLQATGGTFATFAADESITFAGPFSAEGNATLGDTDADNLTVSAAIQGLDALLFDGPTDDTNETTLMIADPTADRTIIVPNASGTLVVSATAPLSIDGSGNITCAGCTGGGGGGSSNSFETIATLLGTSPVAESATDTLTLAAGSAHITVTGDDSSDFVTFDIADDYLFNDGDIGTGTYDFSGAEFAGAVPFVLEGATDNGNETAFAVTDPTGDNVITFQDGTGTVAFLSDIGGGSGDLDDAYDADADQTLAIDNVAGLTVDLTTTGDFIVAAAGTPFATFADDSSLTLTNSLVLTAATDITTGSGEDLTLDPTGAGDLIVTGLDCTGNANGGALTAAADGTISCSDDNTGGGGANSFETWDTPAGTDPVAESSTDTILFASGTANLSITGSAAADSITFNLADAFLLNTGDVGTGDYDFSAAVFQGASPFVLEGSTPDANETTFAVDDPTADRVITFPDGTVTVNAAANISGTTLAANVVTSSLTSVGTLGALTVSGTATHNGNVTLGDAITDNVTAVGAIQGGSALAFDGATDDTNETTFAITDPTADRTITFQNASGTVAFLSDIGASANIFETFSTPAGTSPVADSSTDTLSFAAGSANITITGDATTDTVTFNIADSYLLNTGDSGTGNYDFTAAVFQGTSPFVFEGSTPDANETTFAVADPTADRTITFPDASITVNASANISGTTLAANVVTSSLTSVGTLGSLTVSGASTHNGDVTLGDAVTDAITAAGAIQGASALAFDGATDDTNETTFAITDPTADRVITFQNATGTVAFLSDIGATANIFETMNAPAGTDPVADASTDTLNYAAGSVNITITGDATTDTLTFDIADSYLLNTGDVGTGDYDFTAAVLQGASPLVFEGTTANANETTFAIADPGADRTVTFPDASGEVSLLGQSISDAEVDDTITIGASSTVADGALSANVAHLNVAETIAADWVNTANPWADNEVANALTISGGTIDNSVIGGSTPANGTFLVLAANGNATLGDAITDNVTVTAAIQGASALTFDGATDDTNETTFAITDPTADRTITFQNASGTVAFLSDLTASNVFTTFDAPAGTDPVADSASDTLALVAGSANITITGDETADSITFNIADSYLLNTGDSGTGTYDFTAAVFQGTSPFVLEGTSADANESTVTITDPTADRTFTFPDASGEVSLLGQTISDAEVDDTITVGASGSVADAALSANVAHLNVAETIAADWVNTANPWADNEVANALTISGGTIENTPIGAVTPANGTFLVLTANGNTVLGDAVTDNITVTGAIQGASALVFDGATDNTNETTFSIADPSADRTVTFPDASITVNAAADISGTTLAANVVTSSLTSVGTLGSLAVSGASTHNGNVTFGDAVTDAITVVGAIQGASALVFDGATDDTNETTFAITDPTADRTVTFQNASGTVAYLADIPATNVFLTFDAPAGTDPVADITTDTLTLAAGSANITITGDATADSLTFDIADSYLLNTGDTGTGSYDFTAAVFQGASPFVFDGASDNTNETTFSFTDPSTDRTVTFPDASGEVSLLGQSISDAEVDDTLTIGASSTVADGALSANVAHVNVAETIAGDWVNTANPWADNEVADTLTIGASSTVADGALSANVAHLNVAETIVGDWVNTANPWVDNEVANALTISGGTIDSSVIGGTSPANGTFLVLTANGNVALGDAITDNITVTGAIQGASALVFDGASDNTNETTFSITDPSADRVITFPDASITVNAAGDLSGTTLAANVVASSLTSVGTLTSLTVSGALAANGGITFDSATDTVGAHTMSGTLDMANNLIVNIGNAGTDFVSGGGLTLAGTLTANGNMVIGDAVTDNLTVTAAIQGANALVLDGATDNTNETTIAVTDPSADRTITLPNATGEVSLATVYQNETVKRNPIIWTGTATTNASGVATFNPTSDNTGGGTALFTTIYSVQATAQADVAAVNSVPIASVKAIAGDLRTVTVNAVVSRNVVLAGSALLFTGAGITVNVTIIGE